MSLLRQPCHVTSRRQTWQLFLGCGAITIMSQARMHTTRCLWISREAFDGLPSFRRDQLSTRSAATLEIRPIRREFVSVLAGCDATAGESTSQVPTARNNVDNLTNTAPTRQELIPLVRTGAPHFPTFRNNVACQPLRQPACESRKGEKTKRIHGLRDPKPIPCP